MPLEDIAADKGAITMEQGRYPSHRRRRRKRVNWIGVIFWLVIIALLITTLVVLFKPVNKPSAMSDDQILRSFVDRL